MCVVKRTEQYMDFTKVTRYFGELPSVVGYITSLKIKKYYNSNNNRIFFNVNNKINKTIQYRQTETDRLIR